MAWFDLLLRGGAAVLPGRGEQDCDIAVQDGRTAAVLAPGAPGEAAETIAIPGLVAMPGVIDAHLHLGPRQGHCPAARPR